MGSSGCRKDLRPSTVSTVNKSNMVTTVALASIGTRDLWSHPTLGPQTFSVIDLTTCQSQGYSQAFLLENGPTMLKNTSERKKHKKTQWKRNSYYSSVTQKHHAVLNCPALSQKDQLLEENIQIDRTKTLDPIKPQILFCEGQRHLDQVVAQILDPRTSPNIKPHVVHKVLVWPKNTERWYISVVFSWWKKLRKIIGFCWNDPQSRHGKFISLPWLLWYISIVSPWGTFPPYASAYGFPPKPLVANNCPPRSAEAQVVQNPSLDPKLPIGRVRYWLHDMPWFFASSLDSSEKASGDMRKNMPSDHGKTLPKNHHKMRRLVAKWGNPSLQTPSW